MQGHGTASPARRFFPRSAPVPEPATLPIPPSGLLRCASRTRHSIAARVQFYYYRLLPTEWASRVGLDAQFRQACIQALVKQKAAGQRSSDPQDLLYHFGCLEGPKNTRKHGQYPDVCTGDLEIAVRLFGIDAAPTGIGRAIGTMAQMRAIDGKLAVEAHHGRRYQRPACEMAGVGDQIAGREVVAPVRDDVVGRDDRKCVAGGQSHRMQLDLRLGIDRLQAGAGTLDLGASHIGGRVDDLPLPVGKVDMIVIDNPQRADTAGGQIQKNGGAEAARANHRHPRLHQAPLSFVADLGHDQLTRVAFDLCVAEIVHGPSLHSLQMGVTSPASAAIGYPATVYEAAAP